MLEKMLVLLERFVVAHELIAANSAKPDAVISQVVSGPAANDEAAEPEQKAPAKRTRAPKQKAAPEPEQEEEEVRITTPKSRKDKGEKDIDTLREEIKTMATHIAEGDSDECADEFDDLLEDFKVRTVTKLADDDVEEFHAEAKKIVSKYYELED
jgi:flagellar motor protein MotB